MAAHLPAAGIYTFKEAGQLIGVSHQWVTGILHLLDEVREIERAADPAFGRKLLTFRELIELYLVKQFLSHRITRRQIVLAAKNLHARLAHAATPFALRELWTDDRAIYAAFLEDAPEVAEDLNRTPGQLVWRELSDVRKVVANELEFGADGYVVRWWPAGREGDVLIDPRVRAGEPVLAETRIPTWVLFETWKAEGQSASRTARLHAISAADVTRAVKYEQQLHRAA